MSLPEKEKQVRPTHKTTGVPALQAKGDMTEEVVDGGKKRSCRTKSSSGTQKRRAKRKTDNGMSSECKPHAVALREMLLGQLEAIAVNTDTPPRERLKAIEMLEQLTHEDTQTSRQEMVVRVEVTDET